MILQDTIPQEVIPQEKCEAVVKALREAFGVTAPEEVRLMTRGLTSLVFRIVVRGAPFLLRIIMRPVDHDPTRHFTCMQAAAEAGLAPRVWYTNIEDKVAITDFVEGVPFPVTDALVRMPAALRTLHALPPFPPTPNHLNTTPMFLINKGPALDGFIQRFQAANVLPEGQTEELFAWHAQVAAVYPHHEPDMVSSHCDLKPENVVFDGNRAWLVDWEAAFRNDRYSDLAVFANFVAANEAEEQLYLREYFGKAPDQYQLARFFLMQQVVHLFYTMAYLWLGSASKWMGTADHPVNLSEPAPEFRAFHRSLWAREVNLEDKSAKIVYGRVHWEPLARNMRSARFKEAVRIVSERHGSVAARPQCTQDPRSVYIA